MCPVFTLEEHLDGCYTAPWIMTPLHEDWHGVMGLGKPGTWPKKTLVYDLEDPAKEIVLILEGLLTIVALGSNGGQRTIGILGPGAFLGEAAFFCEFAYRHRIRCVEPCRGIVFSREAVLEIIQNNNALMLYLFRNLAMKSYMMSTQLECTTFMSCEQKIAHFLYHIAVEHQKKSWIYEIISKRSLTTISELLGLHRVTVTNIINSFKKQGILKKDIDGIEVCDVDALLHILHASR